MIEEIHVIRENKENEEKNYPFAKTSNDVIMFADVCIDLQNLFVGIF